MPIYIIQEIEKEIQVAEKELERISQMVYITAPLFQIQKADRDLYQLEASTPVF